MSLKGEFCYRSPSGKEIPVTIADTFKSRFLGLMGKKEGVYGLLLSPCNAIHTCFMRYPLDVLYLDAKDCVITMKRCIKPFSITPTIRGAVKVLEFPSSLQAMAFLEIGTTIHLY